MKQSNLLRWALTGSATAAMVVGAIGKEGTAKADVWSQAPHQMTVQAPESLPEVNSAIARDPFSGNPLDAIKAAAEKKLQDRQRQIRQTSLPASQNITGTQLGQNASSLPSVMNVPGFPGPAVVPGAPPLVPNPGQLALQGSLPPQSGNIGQVYVITTVVDPNGKRPSMALLKNGTSTDIIGIGDLIGGHKVSGIVTQGIEFSDGTRIAISSGQKDASGPANGRSNLGNGLPMGFSGPNGDTMTNGRFTNNGGGTETNGSSAIPSTQASADPNAVQTPGANGVPPVNTTPYQFGPLPTPAPGTNPAPVPHYYGPQPGTLPAGPSNPGITSSPVGAGPSQ